MSTQHKTDRSKPAYRPVFPKVNQLEAQFVYNFFEPNEALLETDDLQSEIISSRPTKVLSAGGEQDYRASHKKIPRYIKLKWSSVQKGAWESLDVRARGNLVSQNEQSIVKESHLTTTMFRSHEFQNDVARYQIMTHVLRIAAFKGMAINPLNSIQQTEITSEVCKSINSGDTHRSLVSDLINEELFYNSSIVNQVNKRSLNIPLENSQKFKTSYHINTKFVSDIFHNGMTGNTHGIKSVRSSGPVSEIQQDTRNESADTYDPRHHYPTAPTIAGPLKNNVADWQLTAPVYATVGYVIKKSRITRGRKVFLENFYIGGTNSTSFLDAKVAYGQTYVYEMSTITHVTFGTDFAHAPGWDVGEWAGVEILVQSDPGSDTVVKCVEEEVPPPPEAVFYRLDHDEDTLMIDWRMPVISQRDIKGFQVFRRSNIWSPFELQAQFDFNDLVGHSSSGSSIFPAKEYPDPKLVVKSQNNSAITSFVDREFNKNTKFIYTVCSIDAHGYLSNYGAQTSVYFDKISKKLVLKSISPPGAPRAYPNMFISPTGAQNVETVRLTEDVLKDSYHSKMRVYFDPDEYALHENEGNQSVSDLNHLATNTNNGIYKLEILNIDRQSGQTISIKLKDVKASST